MSGATAKATEPIQQGDTTDQQQRRRTTRQTAGQAPPRLGVKGPPAKGPRVGTPIPSVKSSKASSIVTTSTVFKSAKSPKSSSSSSHSMSTTSRAALHATLRAQQQLSQIDEEEEDLRHALDRLALENELSKLRRRKELIQQSMELEQLEAEDKEEENGNQGDKSIDDSQELSESEAEHETEDDDDMVPQKSHQVIRKKTFQKKKEFISPIPQMSSTPPSSLNNVADPFAQFSASIADAIMKASQVSKPEPAESSNINTFVGRQLGKDLPTFSGEPKSWTSFIAAFERTTEIGKFSDIENLQRLEKALKGKAKEAVQALMVSPKNVDKIISILQRRFGQPSLIIESIIEDLKFLQVKEDDAESLIEFASHVEGLVATTEHLGRPQYLENPVLVKELVSKLPFHLALRWGDHVYATEDEHHHISIKDFSRWFSRIADSINLAEVSKRSGPEKVKKSKRESIMTTAVPSSSKPKFDRSCLLCQKVGHDLAKCKKYEDSTVDEKWDIIKKSHACFCCLKKGHSLKQCKGRKACGVDSCTRPHHPSLHKRESQPPPPPEMNQDVLVNVTRANDNPRVLLKIAPVRLTGPKGSVETFALLDDAATATLLDSSIAEKLGLQGYHDPLRAAGIGALVFSDSQSRRVSATINGRNCEDSFPLEDIRTVRNIKLPSQSVNLRRLREEWKHLPDVDLHCLKNAKPMLLVGEDNAHLIVSREIIEGSTQGPMMSRTKLGWVIHGNNKDRGQADCEYVNVMVEQQDELHELVKSYWSLETLGVKHSANQAKSAETLRAEKILKETTRRIGQRFETGLLWKYDQLQLPESKQMALKRLYSVEKKMDTDAEYAARYTAKIEDMISKGYAHKLTPEELKIEHPRTWYLPHFGVVNPNKPTKLRIVTDAAAKSHGLSLNDHLMIGPDLFNSLHGVIFKFRQHRYAIGGDIKEMFPQCKIIPQDSVAQRLLWRGSRRQEEPDVYEMSSMIFGAVCSPCSAQYVKNINAQEFQTEFPRAAEASLHRHYMDDFYDSLETVEEAIQLAKDVIEVHSRGGFQICNWMSSSTEVLRQLPESLRSVSDKEIDSCDLQPERILGLHWDQQGDCFQFNFKFHKVDPEVISGKKRPTKREVLKTVMAIFDPMGFLAPFTVHMKILLQDIWRIKLDWDQALPDDVMESSAENVQPFSSPLRRWQHWLEQVGAIQEIKIPRCYFSTNWNATQVSLHVFSDASKKAMSMATYLVMSHDDQVTTAFVMGKSLVAPVRPLTIPKLELQAATLATRMAQTIVADHTLKVTSVTFWTDSRIVLHWLKKDARDLEVFVANRVGEVQEATNVDQWWWCPTKLNVADDGTRDSTDANLSSTSRWLTGPEFLHLSSTAWPEEPKSKLQVDDKEGLKIEYINTLTLQEDDGWPNPTKFSSWSKLIRTTAWMRRFINCYLGKDKGKPWLAAKEKLDAEAMWLRKCQSESFPTEMRILLNNLTTTKKEELPRCSRLLSLNPFLQDGVMCAGSRIRNAPDVISTAKYPAIMDPHHPYTKLLIKFYHEKMNHQGLETVVNELRQKFWIIRVRVAVKFAYLKCQKCKNDRAKPRIPLMADLPTFRVCQQQRPFVQTGVDFFGPMEMTVGRHHEKRYGVLFTCLATRAVHIELAGDLSTDKTIMAIRRFASRRGTPTCLHSDNGTNFRGADNELKKILLELDHAKIQEGLQSNFPLHPMEWKFIAARSPHLGGAWERLVRSVKTALYATLKERYPKEDTLTTLLCEAEHSVNSRPLTHVSLDPKDPEALTPNHFLIGSSSSLQPMGHFSDGDLCLRRQWRISQRLADMFWSRWVREYLPSLTRRSKWVRDSPPLQKGDVVIIADENSPRNSWPKGVVDELYPGKDGRVRVVGVRTNNGIKKRAVHKLIVLDVNQSAITAGEDVDDNQELKV